ncbi:MAG: ribose 5-phosphate isomerase A [Phycisphaeraceae bacterium]|nr:ribose 5-phosphate isomerase A [Phycisphaeraceae bacterium]
MSDTRTQPTVDTLALAAIEPIENGMIVGLGTGLLADRATRALAAMLREKPMDVRCVCASRLTQALAEQLGLRTIPFADVESVDYLIDGASEVDEQMRMLKGHHGAITRQRLIAHVARRCVYLTGEDRLSPRLGSRALLSATIIPFGIASIRARLRNLGLSGVLRRDFDGKVFETDGQGVVLDMTMPDRDPSQLAKELDSTCGVVDHGLFLDEADEVLVECKGGEIKRLQRPDSE